MITFFARAGVIAAAVAGGIAITGAGIAGIVLAVKRTKDRGKGKEPSQGQ